MMRLQIVVPLPTYPEGNSDKLAPHVAAIARHLDAEVHALVLAPDFPRMASPFGNLLIDLPAMVTDAKAKSHARGAALVKALKDAVQPAGLPFGSTEIESNPPLFGETAARYARYHDLVVAGLDAGNPLLGDTAETVMFGAGRPILLVPEQSPAAAFRHVMIAWDGSRVAARAVADARDILQRAEAVTIVSVVDEKELPDDNPGKRLASHLAAHDKKADVSLVKGGDRPIAQTLQEHARTIGADVFVMGAFGHSRVRDFVLGGATAGILKDLRLPALLSH